MSTDGASSPSRLLPRLLGVLLLIMGLALLAGGIKLTMLGGSLYYLLAGIGITLTGILLLATRRAALGLYALVLFASTVWALWEVGLDWWQLVPRLALLFALGIVMLLPWFRRPLLRGQPAPLGTGALSVAVVLAGATALASQFTNPGEMVKTGQLDRDAVPGMASAAPSQFHTSLPVCTSNARITPLGSSVETLSVTWPPITTRFLVTAGGEVE